MGIQLKKFLKLEIENEFTTEDRPIGFSKRYFSEEVPAYFNENLDEQFWEDFF